jgi:hypothetical protein
LDAPSRCGEPVTAHGDDDEVWTIERELHGIFDRLNEDGPSEHSVEDALDLGTRTSTWTNPRAQRRSLGGQGVNWLGDRTRCEDESSSALLAKPLERAAGSVSPIDHHGANRGAGSRLDGTLPTLVDFNEINEGPHDTSEAFERGTSG